MKQISIERYGRSFPPEEAIRLCLQIRNEAIVMARKFWHDLAWLKAHDPEEYEIQVGMSEGAVTQQVRTARHYHHAALRIRRMLRETPKQAVLL